jgi:hypothetical protein
MRKGKDLADRSSRFSSLTPPNQYTDQVLLDALGSKSVRKFGALGNIAGSRGSRIAPVSIQEVGGIPFPFSEDQYAVAEYVINTN